MTAPFRPFRPFRRSVRAGVLALVLATAALVVPDAAVHRTDVLLVQADRAEGVAVRDRDVLWVLAVGSDARPGEKMTRARGDAIQLVGLNTRTGSAVAIGIPRDSWVPIPGHGYGRVNSALTYGGPGLMGRTVGNLVGVQPDYVFVTRFPFFEDMVDDIGGIHVRNPRAFSDENLKPLGFDRGRIKLDGYGAMAFARIRKTLAGGDFDRSANQQRVLRGIQQAVRARADEPGFIERGVLSVLEHMHTDLPPGELFRLGQALAHVDPAKVTTCVVGGSIGNVDGASIVRPFVAQARRYGAAARDDASLRGC
ncbi:LytR family transcriptional regulator [Nocardioides sp. zg-579]|uniref:LytR family transcriptional regulator n=1 Tax=Nocardioides marmotae TaxID=2663857 RepID=A0A6I3JAZ7_9ACTN|nr:LCP family protein [Nocardioides marmotae]MCR6031649.1 LytR family transcriptional regulator [Gordonia jinghuaiqii]MTB95288.1 LytR family transcriptional regulator [Nocardioides marmotae]QKE02246.1 LCP family protein [Nocardioides marmotae]